MVEVVFTDDFKKNFKKIKDNLTKERVIKQIQKIKSNPFIGKPLRYIRGERTLYIKPFRLIYSFYQNIIFLLKFDHRKRVYD